MAVFKGTVNGDGTIFVVSGAGTAAANGNYRECDVSDALPSYKHESNNVYLYRTSSVWYIGPTHGATGDAYYSNTTSSSAPPSSGWSVDNGNADAPSVSSLATTQEWSRYPASGGYYDKIDETDVT